MYDLISLFIHYLFINFRRRKFLGITSDIMTNAKKDFYKISIT